jgi:predicted transcriptional regulator
MPEKNTVPGLGSLETSIMEVMWHTKEATVRDVLHAMGECNAYTTVMTVMQRLYEKGVLQRRLVDGAYIYQAAVPKEQYAKQTVRKTLDQLVHGFGDVALAQFVDVLDDVDPKRLEELRKHLQKNSK